MTPFFLRWLQILLGTCAPLPDPTLSTEQYLATLTQGYEYHERTDAAFAVGGGIVTLSVDHAWYMNERGGMGNMLGTTYLVNDVPARSAPALTAHPLPSPLYCSLHVKSAPHF